MYNLPFIHGNSHYFKSSAVVSMLLQTFLRLSSNVHSKRFLGIQTSKLRLCATRQLFSTLPVLLCL